ncbi:MAG TPA: DUF6343 family protein [Mycobacteriales bacterium]|nr:DUF6343 family protein [Mycobacteriales bacterium]
MRAKESPDTLRRARPGHHDPTTALGGTPALSPLTLRLRLATFGLVVSLIGAVAFVALGVVPVALAFGLIAVTAVVDLAVIQRRRHRGEPG